MNAPRHGGLLSLDMTAESTVHVLCSILRSWTDCSSRPWVGGRFPPVSLDLLYSHWCHLWAADLEGTDLSSCVIRLELGLFVSVFLHCLSPVSTDPVESWFRTGACRKQNLVALANDVDGIAEHRGNACDSKSTVLCTTHWSIMKCGMIVFEDFSNSNKKNLEKSFQCGIPVDYRRRHEQQFVQPLYKLWSFRCSFPRYYASVFTVVLSYREAEAPNL